MSITVRQLEFANHNSQRRYPLALGTTAKDLTGTLELPNDFLIGLTLSIPWTATVYPGKFLLWKVTLYAGGFTLTIGYDTGSGIVPVASAVVPLATHTENKVYGLFGEGDFADSHGHVMIGVTEQVVLQPPGAYEFNMTGAMLEPDTIRPNIRGITSFQIDADGSLSQPYYGHIRLKPVRNLRITPQVSGNVTTLLFDAIEGEGLAEQCICYDDAEPIKTINAVPPDGSGNIQVFGNECIELIPGDHSLLFNDLCSKPCCGPKELEILTGIAEGFGAKFTTLENFLNGLEGRVTTFDLTVLGARLGDRGCQPECP